MTQTALVTGCAGFIGSHLVDLLLEKGYRVIGIDNMRTGQRVNLPSEKTANFDFHKMDVCDTNLEFELSETLDVVYHLAAISSIKWSVENPLLVNCNNVEGTVNVLNLARQKGAKRVVLTSSAAVYGHPESLPISEEIPVSALSPYGASKIAAEQYMRAFQHTYGIESVILRLFNVYGPRQACSEYSGVISIFINQGLFGQPITIEGDGTQTRSFVYVSDVVKALHLAGNAFEASGQTINISGSKSITIQELATKVKSTIGQTDSKIIHVPPRQGDIKHSMGSIEKAGKILGFAPETPFDIGLERTIEWYRANPSKL